MGASPDGVCSCQCHENRLLEIKCPYKYRTLHPLEAANMRDKNYCLNIDGQLSKTHPYYFQVQMQLMICQLTVCDFVVWTNCGMFIAEVAFDQVICDKIYFTIGSFVRKHLIKEILTRSLLSYADDATANEYICICNRPQFGKIVLCSKKDCKIVRFHYECVGIKRKPIKAWFCTECNK